LRRAELKSGAQLTIGHLSEVTYKGIEIKELIEDSSELQ
jgi:hypothetical protein